MNKTKVCVTCGIEKELNDENFPKRVGSSDGYRNECKSCRNLRNKKYRESHIEETKEYQKVYREKHIKEMKAYQDIYRENHRSEIKRKRRTVRAANKEYKRWCKSEKETLKIVYPYIENDVLAERFGTSIGSIEGHAYRLGLKKAKGFKGKFISAAKKKNNTYEHKPYYQGDYKMIYAPDHPRKNFNNRVPEHILIMEKELGRYLKEGERVYHIDNNGRNNDISNLGIHQCTTVKSVNCDEIIEKRKSGMKIKDLQQEYNIGLRTLYKILNKNKEKK